MVDFNDRRFSRGDGTDFNNPRGTFSITSHGYDDADRWSQQSPQESRGEVVKYYRGQKNSRTWREANRLAKSRTDHGARRGYFKHGADYANAYQDNLARVMASKGPRLAEQFGEVSHKQTGYGRP